MTQTIDLIGKFLVIYVMGGDVKYPTSMLVKNVEEIANRTFIIGKQPESIMGLYNWLGEVETYIAWENVTEFHIFDDYESFQKLASNHPSGGLFSKFRKS
ncbi:hypothetical protein [Marinicella gelatinilytica]|uniref:hypothetical protein n=1 Tax=Marinicella gelatinilytica TaxID=2996017 RepID=UPI002260D74C|nr:hypothetical protein [Marinicella gelatinilytica]MCX7546201.1 hypothetical protein [Marinicella gelatinilytica]